MLILFGVNSHLYFCNLKERNKNKDRFLNKDILTSIYSEKANGTYSNYGTENGMEFIIVL